MLVKVRLTVITNQPDIGSNLIEVHFSHTCTIKMNAPDGREALLKVVTQEPRILLSQISSIINVWLPSSSQVLALC